MKVGNLYVVSADYNHDNDSDLFILIRLENKPPEKGVNQKPLPIGFFRNLKTGESLKIIHPENHFEPIGDSK